MCGFAGFTNHIDHADVVLEEMKKQIEHRGPDGDGTYLDDDIALGFRRLSIIDLEGANQPLFNEDESLVLLFNGEIYNYQDIRKDLVEAGHQFKTHGDGEVILHSYEEYGQDFISRFRGMFAFVIWDKNKKQLFGARDYFGIKPFYYANMGDSFLFGSEIKSFLPHPDFKKELNEKALEQYLSFQYSAYEETFFKNVFKLPPAHYFIHKDGKTTITRYWQIEFTESNTKPLEAIVDEVEEAFDDTVKSHMVSDVEVGSFLSGGVDSSYVVASAGVDKTFSVGFNNGSKYNEMHLAKELSEIVGVKNVQHVVTPEEYWSAFPKVQYHMDEPLADPSIVPLYYLSNIASKEVKVVLSGEGSDELFGGYNIYKEPLEGGSYDKIPFPVRKLIGKVASLFPAKRGFNFLVRRGKKLEDRFIGNAYIFSEKERKKLLKIKTGAEAPEALCRKYYDQVKDKAAYTKMQYLDIHMWLTGDILLKADKMAMANSLEVRVPFLDKEIAKTAADIPGKYRVSTKATKIALRKAANRRMPEDWAKRKKLGFPVPIRVWLKEDQYIKVVKKAFTSPAAKKYFNTDALLDLLKKHKEGKADNSRKIWTVYTFLVWYEQFFGKEAAA